MEGRYCNLQSIRQLFFILEKQQTAKACAIPIYSQGNIWAVILQPHQYSQSPLALYNKGPKTGSSKWLGFKRSQARAITNHTGSELPKSKRPVDGNKYLLTIQQISHFCNPKFWDRSHTVTLCVCVCKDKGSLQLKMTLANYARENPQCQGSYNGDQFFFMKVYHVPLSLFIEIYSTEVPCPGLLLELFSLSTTTCNSDTLWQSPVKG